MSAAVQPPPGRQPITSRSRLLSLLSDACEIEHALLCSYLYSAFSLKQELSEGGMTWRQQQRVRAWAAQIYAVAAEEMLHLAQAWNLLAAIGGMPYYHRPGFPQPATYYPMNIPLALTPFGEDTLKRFIMYELPSHIAPEEMARRLGLPAEQAPKGEDLTVGELYELIAGAFRGIPENVLFVGAPSQQIGQDIIDFPDIIKVTDRESAVAAVQMIVRQGEGTSQDDLNCHFGMFLNVLEEFRSETAKGGAAFDPVRRVVSNPVIKITGFEGDHGVTLVADAYASEVAQFFNDVYGLMMRMLQFSFSCSIDNAPVVKTFAKNAIVVMVTVLKPVGEALMLLPNGPDDTMCAGPEFGLARHVALPAEPAVADRIVRERLGELLVSGNALAEDGRAPPQLRNAVRNLAQYAG